MISDLVPLSYDNRANEVAQNSSDSQGNSRMASKQLHVLMPTFNRKHMLDRTLLSLLSQDADPDLWQLTVVDNASTDDTTSLLDGYVEKFPNFDYVVNERNLGLFGNLNRCMNLARTEKYMIVHSDDDVDPTLVSSVLDFIGRHPDVKMIFGRCRARFAETGELVPYWYNSRMLGEEERMLDRHELVVTLMRSASNFIFAPTVIYDRNFFSAELRYSEDYEFTSDLDLWFRVALKDPKVAFIPKPQMTCGIHAGRLSSTNANSMRLEAITIIRKYLMALRSGPDADLIGARLALFIRMKLEIYELAIRLHVIPGFKLRRLIAACLEVFAPRPGRRAAT
jgi:glycosyltransferase involved in cell wall biosynthesis